MAAWRRQGGPAQPALGGHRQTRGKRGQTEDNQPGKRTPTTPLGRRPKRCGLPRTFSRHARRRRRAVYSRLQRA
eukprot:338953-Prymnesium_polylepis.1